MFLVPTLLGAAIVAFMTLIGVIWRSNDAKAAAINQALRERFDTADKVQEERLDEVRTAVDNMGKTTSAAAQNLVDLIRDVDRRVYRLELLHEPHPGTPARRNTDHHTTALVD